MKEQVWKLFFSFLFIQVFQNLLSEDDRGAHTLCTNILNQKIVENDPRSRNWSGQTARCGSNNRLHTDGGIVPGLRYEVHRGCKGTAFPRNFCVLQNAFTGSKTRKQGPTDHFILPNHPEIHEKLFSGVKVGISLLYRRYLSKACASRIEPVKALLCNGRSWRCRLASIYQAIWRSCC